MRGDPSRSSASPPESSSCATFKFAVEMRFRWRQRLEADERLRPSAWSGGKQQFNRRAIRKRGLGAKSLTGQRPSRVGKAHRLGQFHFFDMSDGPGAGEGIAAGGCIHYIHLVATNCADGAIASNVLRTLAAELQKDSLAAKLRQSAGDLFGIARAPPAPARRSIDADQLFRFALIGHQYIDLAQRSWQSLLRDGRGIEDGVNSMPTADCNRVGNRFERDFQLHDDSRRRGNHSFCSIDVGWAK